MKCFTRITVYPILRKKSVTKAACVSFLMATLPVRITGLCDLKGQWAAYLIKRW